MTLYCNLEISWEYVLNVLTTKWGYNMLISSLVVITPQHLHISKHYSAYHTYIYSDNFYLLIYPNKAGKHQVDCHGLENSWRSLINLLSFSSLTCGGVKLIIHSLQICYKNCACTLVQSISYQMWHITIAPHRTAI